MWDFPLFPDRASSIAGDVDLIYFVLLALSVLIAAGIVIIILYFAVRYRSTAEVDRSNASTGNALLETTWMVVPMVLATGVFIWASIKYFDMQKMPRGDVMEISAIGKQWMWKFQHPDGAREINTLHVPVGQTVQVRLTSQDVIHSFYVPAFRVKQDALPGRYTHAWFKATKPGTYHLFCAEYCGTEHSKMGGWVYVMAPAAYEEWLRTGDTGGSNTEPGTGRYERTPSGGATDQPFDVGATGRSLEAGPPGRTPGAEGEPSAAQVSMVGAGETLFRQLRCNSCHRVDSTALYPDIGPALEDLYGHPAELQNNRTIIADAQYLRESILHPQAKLVAGYPAVMPTFKGQISESELMQLVAYLQSLSRAPSAAAADTTGAAADTAARPLPVPLPPNSQSQPAIDE